MKTAQVKEELPENEAKEEVSKTETEELPENEINEIPGKVEDKEKKEKFLSVLNNSILTNDYVTAYKILAEARDFVTGNIISTKTCKQLESIFNKKLKEKLIELGFVDISGKILSTTFWAMISSGNLALKGPPGVGKSYFSKAILPELWVQNRQKPFVLVIQPDRNMDIASLVADRGIKQGETIVEEGQIADAVNLVNRGHRVILVLEEINQWPAKVLKDINDFLEERKLERKIAGKSIKLECSKQNLFIIANYNPEGFTLGDDDTGSVSSRFIFCDLPFPSKADLENIIEINISNREFSQTSIGDEIKRRPTKPFLRSMSDICYSIRSSIDSGEFGPLAMPIGTRNIINFSKALLNNNNITDAILKSLVDPILEKYVREGPLTNVEPKVYEEYIRTVFKAVKQVLGTIDNVDEKNLKSLQKGLNITISDLYQFQGKKPYEITIRKSYILEIKKPSVKQLEPVIAQDLSTDKEELPKSEPLSEVSSKKNLMPKGQQENLEQQEILPTLSSSTSLPEKVEPNLIQPTVPGLTGPLATQQASEEETKPAEVKQPKTTLKSIKPSSKMLCLKCGTIMSVAVDSRGKKNLICDNPDCRNILPIPQYGEIRIIPKNCKICGSTILQINRRNNKIIHICPVCWRNPEINGPCETCHLFSQCVR